jgi:hypothetical protein
MMTSGNDTAGAGNPPMMIDPTAILFSMPTLANDTAPLEPVERLAPSDLVFHEDEWRQAEYFQRARLDELKHKLAELKAFVEAHRQGAGWRDIYMRELSPEAVIVGPTALVELAGKLGVAANPGPVLFTGVKSLVGRAAGGFSLPVGGDVSLYGLSGDAGVSILGSHVAGADDDGILVKTFAALSAGFELVLVDWRSQMILIGVNEHGRIDVWKP